MKLTGRRESQHVEDRRGMGGGAKAGIGGIGAIIVAALFAWISGGDPVSAGLQAAQQQMSAQTETVDPENFTEEEQQLATECKQILASTEDVWGRVFQELGRTYEPPTLVLFSNQVNSACGSATAAVGPFYCSGDQKLYIDLSFFTTMKRQIGADGDFSYAYVIAHEIGHHVENSLGILGKAHQQMSQTDKVRANQISVRLELLADYYAGVWAHYDNEEYNSLEDGDVEEAIDCAQKIGDNYLQKKAQGYVQPESFTHGTSAQRMKWLKLGIQTGNMNTTTFGVPESQL